MAARRIENERPVAPWIVLSGLVVLMIVAGYGLLVRLMTEH